MIESIPTLDKIKTIKWAINKFRRDIVGIKIGEVIDVEYNIRPRNSEEQGQLWNINGKMISVPVYLPEWRIQFIITNKNKEPKKLYKIKAIYIHDEEVPEVIMNKIRKNEVLVAEEKDIIIEGESEKKIKLITNFGGQFGTHLFGDLGDFHESQNTINEKIWEKIPANFKFKVLIEDYQGKTIDFKIDGVYYFKKMIKTPNNSFFLKNS